MANVWYLSNKLFLGKLGREKKTVDAHQTRPRYEVVQQTLHPHILRLGTGSFCLLPILSIIFPIYFPSYFPSYFPYISHIETTILHRISRRFPWDLPLASWGESRHSPHAARSHRSGDGCRAPWPSGFGGEDLAIPDWSKREAWSNDSMEIVTTYIYIYIYDMK